MIELSLSTCEFVEESELYEYLSQTKPILDLSIKSPKYLVMAIINDHVNSSIFVNESYTFKGKR